MSSDNEAHAGLAKSLAQFARSGWLAARLVWQAGPVLLVGLVLLALVQSAMAPLELWLMRRAVNALSAWLGDGHGGVGEPAGWLGLLLAALVAGVLMTPLAGLVKSLLGDRMQAKVTTEVIEVCNGWVGIERFEDPTFADDLEVVRRHTGRLVEVVAYGMRAATSLFTIVAVALTLGGAAWWLPLVVLVGHSPMLVLNHRFQRLTGSMLYVLTPAARRLSYLRELAVRPDEAKDVRLGGLHGYLRSRYRREWRDSVGEVDRTRWRQAARLVLAELASTGAVVACYAYVVLATWAGSLSIGTLVMVAAGLLMLSERLDMLGFDIGFLPFAMAFIPGMNRVLTAPSDLPVAARPAPTPEVPGTISFHDVSFRYPGTDEPVLSGLSFDLDAGSSLALVGGNGAGKTTLVKLLLRLYDPTSGRITVDGVDLRALDPREWRRRVGVIFQDFGRYELSLRDNIALADLERRADDAAVARAAAEAGADAVVQVLPDGLETRLGRWLGERELSGGQWQRVALARAYMAERPILVLDEPTAELDPRAEHHVYQRFAELTRGRSTIVISHRFSTARLADRILVLQQGRLIEDGTHETLLAARGEYARMFVLQAEQYQGEQDQHGDPWEPVDAG